MRVFNRYGIEKKILQQQYSFHVALMIMNNTLFARKKIHILNGLFYVSLY